jgi:alpha,alpha-trehalose phosphorylase
VTASRAEYTLLTDGTMPIAHYGEPLVLDQGVPVTRRIAPIPPREPPRQPRGRAPRRRSPG